MPRTKKEPDPRPPGRPPDGDAVASERIEFRVTPEQDQKYRAAAERAGLTLKAWIAGELDAAVGRPPARSKVTKIKTELERVLGLVDEL